MHLDAPVAISEKKKLHGHGLFLLTTTPQVKLHHGLAAMWAKGGRVSGTWPAPLGRKKASFFTFFFLPAPCLELGGP